LTGAARPPEGGPARLDPVPADVEQCSDDHDQEGGDADVDQKEQNSSRAVDVGGGDRTLDVVHDAPRISIRRLLLLSTILADLGRQGKV
jgi:hypothetical protein